MFTHTQKYLSYRLKIALIIFIKSNKIKSTPLSISPVDFVNNLYFRLSREFMKVFTIIKMNRTLFDTK